MANSQQINVGINFQANVSQAKQQIESLQSSLKKIAETEITVQGGGIQNATDSANQLAVALQKATNVDTGKLDMSALRSSLKSMGTDISKVSTDLISIGPEGQKAFSQLTTAISNAELPAKRLNSVLVNFGDTLIRTIRWQVASSLIHGFMGTVQSAVGYIEDLDKSLNAIQVVTRMNTNEMEGFAKVASRLSDDLRTTTKEYSDAALIFFQQGLEQNEVIERTEATIKLARVTGESVSQVSNQLTAIWNNFDDGSKSLEYYADVITALGAATASSSDEISQGLSKFASVAETVGLSYEYATAALATVTAETRQSADVIGTSFRTIFARMQGLSLGETLDDGVTLNKYSRALAEVGVNILDQNKQLKNMDTILDELADRWKLLSEGQQVALAETVAGVRQYSQFLALMNNYNKVQANVDIARSSEGTIDAQFDIYTQSIEALDKEIQKAKEDVFDTLLDSDSIKEFKEALVDALEFAERLVKSFGGLKGIIFTLGSLLLTNYLPQIQDRIIQIGSNLKDRFGITEAQNRLDLRSQRDMSQALAGDVKVGDQQSILNGSSSEVEAAYQTEILNKRIQLSENSAKYTDLQKEQIQNQINQLQILKDQIVATKELLEAEKQRKEENQYKEDYEKYRNTRSVVRELSSPENLTGEATYYQYMEDKYTSNIKTAQEELAGLSGKKDDEIRLGVNTEIFQRAQDNSISIEQAKNELLKEKQEELKKAEEAVKDLDKKQQEESKTYIDNLNREIEYLREKKTLTAELLRDAIDKDSKSVVDLNNRRQIAQNSIEENQQGLQELNERARRHNVRSSIDEGSEFGEYLQGIFENLRYQSLGNAINNNLVGSINIEGEARNLLDEESGETLAKGLEISKENMIKLSESAGKFKSIQQDSATIMKNLNVLQQKRTLLASKGNKEDKQTLALKQEIKKEETEIKTQVEQFVKKVGESSIESKALEGNIKKIQENVDNISDPEGLGKLQQNFKNTSNTAGEFSNEMGALSDRMRNDLVNSSQEAGQEAEQLETRLSQEQQAAEQNGQALMTLINALRQFTQEQERAAAAPNPGAHLKQGMQEAVGAFSAGVMGLNMFNSGFNQMVDSIAEGNGVLATLTGTMMMYRGVLSVISVVEKSYNAVQAVRTAYTELAAIAEGKLQVAESKSIVTKIALAAANVLAKESTQGLVGVVKAAIGVTAALAIGATILAVAKGKEAKANLRAAEASAKAAEASAKVTEENKKELESVEELNEAYEEAYKIWEKTHSNKEEINKASLALAEQLDIENAYVLAQANYYEQLNEEIETAIQNKTKEAQLDAQFNTDNAAKNLENQIKASEDTNFTADYHTITFDVTSGVSFSDQADFQKFVNENFSDAGWNFNDWGDLQTTDYSKIGNLEEIFNAYQEYLIKEFGKETALSSKILENFNKEKSGNIWSEIIPQYQEALDSQREMAVTSKIINQDGLKTAKTFEEYKESRKDLAGILEEEEKELAKQHLLEDESTKAYEERYQAIQSLSADWQNSIDNDITKFMKDHHGMSEDDAYALWFRAQIIAPTPNDIKAIMIQLQSGLEGEKVVAAAQILPTIISEAQGVTIPEEMKEFNDQYGETILELSNKYKLGIDTMEEFWSAGNKFEILDRMQALTDATDGYINILDSAKKKRDELIKGDISREQYQKSHSQDYYDQEYERLKTENEQIEQREQDRQHLIQEIQGDQADTYTQEQQKSIMNALKELYSKEEKQGELRALLMNPEKYLEYNEDDLAQFLKEANLNDLGLTANQFILAAQRLNLQELLFGEVLTEEQLVQKANEAAEKAAGQYYDSIKDGTEVKQAENDVFYARSAEITQKENSLGLDPGVLESYQKVLAETNPELKELAENIDESEENAKEYNLRLRELTATELRIQKGVDTLTSNWEDWNKVLNDSSINAIELAKVLPEIKSAIGDLLDLDDKDLAYLPETFVSSNWKLIQEWSKATGEEAQRLWLRLRELAVLASQEARGAIKGAFDIDSTNATKPIEDQYLALKQIIEDNPITMTAEGRADMSQLILELKAAGANAKWVADYLASIGQTHIKIQGSTGDIGTFNLDTPEGLLDFENAFKTFNAEIKAVGGYVPSKGVAEMSPAGKGGGGGGGGGSRSKKDLKERDDEIERYHQIDKTIDSLAKQYTRLKNARDAAYGADKLKILEQETKLIQQQTNAARERAKEAENYLRQDRANIEAYGAIIDENGVISNYEQIMDEQLNKLNSIYSAYNAGGSSDEAVEKAEKEYDQFKEILSQYEETYSTFQDALEEVAEKVREQVELALEKIDVSLQLKLDIPESEIKKIEFRLKRLEDSGFAASQRITQLNAKLEQAEKKSQSYMEALREAFTVGITDDAGNLVGGFGFDDATIDALLEGRTEVLEGLGLTGENKQAVLDKLEELRDNLEENWDEIHETLNQIQEEYTNAFSEYVDELEREVSRIEKFGNIMQGVKDLIGTMGKDTLGISSQVITRMNQMILSNSQANIASMRKEQKGLQEVLRQQQQELEEARERYAQNSSIENANALKFWEKQVKTTEDKIDDMTDSLISKVNDFAQKAGEILQEEIKSAFDEVANSLYGMSFEDAQASFDRYKALSDATLQDYQKIYELSKLTRQVTNSIDETDNIKAKQLLRDLQAEINQYQAEGVKMTQYEVDYLNKKYELRLAEIALEEAQNAKDQVRLARNADGGWGYVYTANAENIESAQQNYEDKLYALQELNRQTLEDTTSTILQINKEYQDAMVELVSSGLSPEDLARRQDELAKHYGSLLGIYTSTFDKALANNRSLYTNEWDNLNTKYGYPISADRDFIDKFEETWLGQQGIPNGLNSAVELFEKFQQRLGDSTTPGTVLYNCSVGFQSYVDSLKQALEASGLGEGGDFGSSILNTLSQFSSQTDEIAGKVDILADKMKTDMASIADSVSDAQSVYSNKLTILADNIEKVTNATNALRQALSQLASINYSNIVPSASATANIPPVTVNTSGNGGSAGGSGTPSTTNPWNLGGEYPALTTYYTVNLVRRVGGKLDNIGSYTSYSDAFKALMDRYKVMTGATGSNRDSVLNTPQYWASAQVYSSIQLNKAGENKPLFKLDFNLISGSAGSGPNLMAQYDSGGYTGSFGPEGRMAVLHEKELVLNKEDTENVLGMVSMAREAMGAVSLGSHLSNIKAYNSRNNTFFGGAGIGQQTVSIEAHFPNVVDHFEIEQALTNLANYASQNAYNFDLSQRVNIF